MGREGNYHFFMHAATVRYNSCVPEQIENLHQNAIIGAIINTYREPFREAFFVAAFSRSYRIWSSLKINVLIRNTMYVQRHMRCKIH